MVGQHGLTLPCTWQWRHYLKVMWETLTSLSLLLPGLWQPKLAGWQNIIHWLYPAYENDVATYRLCDRYLWLCTLYQAYSNQNWQNGTRMLKIIKRMVKVIIFMGVLIYRSLATKDFKTVCELFITFLFHL